MRPILSYLLNYYPAVSHTFFLNEIRHLREHSLDIQVASINSCAIPADRCTLAEKEEIEQTTYIKKRGIFALFDNLKLLVTKPFSYFSALTYALSLSNGSPKKALYRLFYFLEASAVVCWMQRTGSKHLHVHFGSEVATVAIIAKKLGDISLSLTIHGSDEFYDAPGYHLNEKIQMADFIFCISHYTSSQLMRLSSYSNWHKIIVSPLGIDIEKFKPADHPEVKNKSATINLLCVARLNAAKGIHLLIHALEKLSDKHDFHLTLVGDGEERDSIESLVKRLHLSKQVTFAGSVNQDEILSYYHDADIFCLPSFAEGVPVVLMEAMAMGLPCVSSKITGIPELIKNNKEGVLVTAGDINAIKEGLATLFESPELRKEIGNAARDRIVTDYNMVSNYNALALQFAEKLHIDENLIPEKKPRVTATSTIKTHG